MPFDHLAGSWRGRGIGVALLLVAHASFVAPAGAEPDGTDSTLLSVRLDIEPTLWLQTAYLASSFPPRQPATAAHTADARRAHDGTLRRFGNR